MMTMDPDDPSLVGQSGTASGSFLVHVEAGGTAIGEPTRQFEVENSLSLQVSLSAGNGVGQYAIECDVVADESGYCSDGTNLFDNPTTQTVTVPFVFTFTWGTPFELRAEVGGDSLSVNQAGSINSSDPNAISYTADGSANFLNTVLWQGISEVRDADGNLVQFALSSDSGTDWEQPATAVPAPPALWLFATGMVGLLARARRRASASSFSN